MSLLCTAVLQYSTEGSPGPQDLEMIHSYIERSAFAGADIIFLPPCFSTAEEQSRNIWASAQGEGGPLLSWIREQAMLYDLRIGAGLIVRERSDIFNRYYIIGRDGRVAGHVPMFHPLNGLFAHEHRAVCIRTDIGSIAVGYCLREDCTTFIRRVRSSEAVLSVIIHPCLEKEPQQADAIRELPVMISSQTGIPVVTLRTSGWKQTGGLHYAAICTDPGAIETSLEDEEGLILADVHTKKAPAQQTGRIRDLSLRQVVPQMRRQAHTVYRDACCRYRYQKRKLLHHLSEQGMKTDLPVLQGSDGKTLDQ